MQDNEFTHIEIETDKASNVKNDQLIINDYISNINSSLYTVTWEQNNYSLMSQSLYDQMETNREQPEMTSGLPR